jgi:hypothetical protein
MTALKLDVETKGQARSRLIARVLVERKRLFAMIEIEEDAAARDRMFEQWKELTRRIEALNQ